MMRCWIGLIVIGFGAARVQAQSSACTYDTCALRLRSRFFSGMSIVQGHDARRVAKLGLFAPHVDVLASGSDSVRSHFQAFRKHQSTGGALTLIGALAGGVAAGLAYDRAHYDAHKTAFWSLAAVSLTFSLWGGAHVTSGRDHLERSIWFYNRDLPRSP